MDFSTKPKEQTTPNNLLNELSRRLNDNTRRIRVLEEKLDNVEGRVNTIEKRMVDDFKQAHTTFANLSEDIKNITDRITNFEVDLKKTISNTSKKISRKELIELQEYIKLITPISSKFTTKKEVEELIKEHLNK